MSTTYLTATTLDGFIATEAHDLSWLLDLEGEISGNPYDDFIAGVGAMAMGASTYTWVMEHEKGTWPYDLPTWVFTHRDLARPADGQVRLTEADVAEVHAELVAAAAGRDVWLVGGGDLVGQFLDRDLLDEIWVSIAPVLLGSGAPLLPRRRTEQMRLLEVRHPTGDPMVHLHYSLR